MRWTTLAIAVAIGACAKGERDQSSQSAADSAMSADTAGVDTSPAAASLDTGAPKKAAGAATTKTKPAKSDTAAAARTTAAAKPGAPTTTGPTGAEAMMGVRAAAVPRELSADQVKQLQTALKKDGCYTGKPDGVSGPGTQQAIECGLKKYKLAPGDLSGLYRKLGLDF